MIDRLRAWIASLWQSEKFRYLATGAFNTAASYLEFAILYYCLTPLLHYMVVLVINAVLNVTTSFLTNKFIVFKTRGNYIREYLRCTPCR